MNDGNHSYRATNKRCINTECTLKSYCKLSVKFFFRNG